jgi:polyhydroxyalkanoate synthesis regulator phasin
MVAKGEMNTEEARRFVEDMMKQAQQPQTPGETSEKTEPSEPRRIEIIGDEEEPSVKEVPKDNVDHLRQQVLDLKKQLEQLKREQ